jgi:hypothetical protein
MTGVFGNMGWNKAARLKKWGRGERRTRRNEVEELEELKINGPE